MTTTTSLPRPSAATLALGKAKCNGSDHWMVSRDGRRLWCMPDECVVHGTGRER